MAAEKTKINEKTETKNDQKNEPKGFSRFKGMLENIKRGTLVTLAAGSMVLAVNCGNGDTHDGGDHDSGTPHDGDTVQDGGDSGGSTTPLCTLYGEGHQNRKTFNLGDVEKPGDNTEGYLMFFRAITIYTNGDTYASFGVYHESLTSSADVYGFQLNQQRDVPVGTVNVKFELCNRTAQECDITAPGMTPHGDVNCTATLASDKAWGQ